MPTAAWHSIKQPIYHNNKGCHNGNNIEKENLRSGEGAGRKLCKTCRDLNRKRR